jgi:hypothetical protein
LPASKNLSKNKKYSFGVKTTTKNIFCLKTFFPVSRKKATNRMWEDLVWIQNVFTWKTVRKFTITLTRFFWKWSGIRGFYDEADFTFSNISSIKLKQILLRMGIWSRIKIFRANEREQTSFLHA